MRSTGAGVAYAVGRIGGMVCPLVAVGLVTSCHQTAAILLLEALIVLSVVVILLIPFETKGKELVNTIDGVSNSKQVLVVALQICTLSHYKRTHFNSFCYCFMPVHQTVTSSII